jgi:hypothetical protein
VALSVLQQDLQDSGAVPQGRGRADSGFLPYEIKNNQIWLIDDQGGRPLCNFWATITEEVCHDNGTEEETFFQIEGCLHDGTRLRRRWPWPISGGASMRGISRRIGTIRKVTLKRKRTMPRIAYSSLTTSNHAAGLIELV